MLMNVYYMLDPIEAEKSKGAGKGRRCLLTPITSEEAVATKHPIVKVISSEEFDKLPLISDLSMDFIRSLVEAETNYVDEYPDYVIGSFSIPSKKSNLDELDTFAFYMDEQMLIFGDDTGTAAKNLSDIADLGVIGTDTTSHCLYVFIKQFLVDDVVYLGKMEDEMERLEEAMLAHHQNVGSGIIMEYRRRAMRITSYYNQIGVMADILADNENKELDHEQVQAYGNLANYADHLAARGESLENYGLELYQLHQTTIDLAQNSIMQTLTIVTVILAPLTLITSWFGMNIILPGTQEPLMWIALLATCAVIIAILVVHFHRRRWL